MRNPKTSVAAAMLLLLLPALATAQITTIGVVDIDYVDRFFHRASESARDVRLKESDYKETLSRFAAQTAQLETSYLRAVRQDEKAEAISILRELSRWNAHVSGYKQLKRTEIRDLSRYLRETDHYSQILGKAIAHVALEEGYSVIFDRGSELLAFVGRRVDVTEAVLRLMIDWL